MVKPNYFISKPSCTGNFEEQWQSCFDNFQLFLNEYPNQKAFIVHVFIAAENPNEFLDRAAEIKVAFYTSGIPVSFLSQFPEKPNLVMIEAGFADSSNVLVEYNQAESVKFCKLATPGYAEYWFAGIEGNQVGDNISVSAENAFSKIQSTFLKLGLGFNQIVRQWNYVEQIFGFQQIDLQPRQYYQLFNEVRGKYYSCYRTVPDFPAATGIGTAFHGVTIECMVVTSDESLKIVPVSNPNQLNSYKYGQTVLKGEPLINKNCNQPPLFERAKLMTNGKSSRLFISGTAAVVGQETIGLNDVVKQTWVTIDNIELLTSKINLQSHYPELTVIPDKYTYVRVYIKNEEDIPTVKAICLDHFGEVPMSFVKADICRADLLIEIEAEKIS
jgi:enamine deaminase RidA (YjgF/YER057c/UK114 family)